MSLSSMKLIGQTVFELEFGNKNVDRQTDGQTDGQTDKNGQTDRQTNGRNYTNFERNLAMMGSMSLSSMKPIGQTVFEFRKQKCGRTAG